MKRGLKLGRKDTGHLAPWRHPRCPVRLFLLWPQTSWLLYRPVWEAFGTQLEVIYFSGDCQLLSEVFGVLVFFCFALFFTNGGAVINFLVGGLQAVREGVKLRVEGATRRCSACGSQSPPPPPPLCECLALWCVPLSLSLHLSATLWHPFSLFLLLSSAHSSLPSLLQALSPEPIS